MKIKMGKWLWQKHLQSNGWYKMTREYNSFSAAEYWKQLKERMAMDVHVENVKFFKWGKVHHIFLCMQADKLSPDLCQFLEWSYPPRRERNSSKKNGQITSLHNKLDGWHNNPKLHQKLAMAHNGLSTRSKVWITMEKPEYQIWSFSPNEEVTWTQHNVIMRALNDGRCSILLLFHGTCVTRSQNANWLYHMSVTLKGASRKQAFTNSLVPSI